MGWNEPNGGSKQSRKEPWGGKQPPDLDEALKRLQKYIKSLFVKNTSPSAKKRVIYKKNNNNSNLLITLSLLILFVIWVASGIFIVDPAEQAALLRFGRYVETVGPGPHWIPRFIMSKIVLNVDRVSDYSYSAQMLTKDENLVSVSVVVQYRIGDLQDYLFNVVDAIESLKQATSSALRQVVGTTTLDQLITEGRDAWGNSVQDSLSKLLESYKTGIVIVNVSPQPARAPEHVQDAFDDAIKAQEDEKRFKEQARAYAARVIPIAEGNAKRIDEEAKAYAASVVLRAQGATAEFLQLLPEYTRAPYVTAKRMYLDTMQKVLTASNKIIVDTQTNNVFSLPLEQLQNKIVATTLPKTTLASNSPTKITDKSLMLDDRNVDRILDRPGRSD